MRQLMRAAPERYRTLTATLYESYDDRIVARDEDLSGYGYEAVTDLVVAPPDRLWAARRSPGGELELLVVLDGRQRYMYSAGWGGHVEEQQPGDLQWALGPAGELLDPAALAGALEPTSVWRMHEHERDVFVVQATPRKRLPRSLGTADEEELVVDAERGVVIRLVGSIGFVAARTLELQDVRFDVDLPDEAFRFAPPDADDVSGLDLAAAAALASFRLWALRRPPLEITFRGARPDRDRPESVRIEYADVSLVETSTRAWAGHPVGKGTPRRVDRAGRAHFLTPGGLWLAVEGTSITLESPGADDERLLELAEALVRVDP